jgi:hypothetical protein
MAQILFSESKPNLITARTPKAPSQLSSPTFTNSPLCPNVSSFYVPIRASPCWTTVNLISSIGRVGSVPLDFLTQSHLARIGTHLWNQSSSMRLLAGDQIPAVVAACTCPTASTGHILLPSSPLMYPTSPLSTTRRIPPYRSRFTRESRCGLSAFLPLRCVAVWKLNGAPSIQVSFTWYNWAARQVPP